MACLAQGQHPGYKGDTTHPACARGQYCQAAQLFSLNPKYRAAGGPHHLAGAGMPGETRAAAREDAE